MDIPIKCLYEWSRIPAYNTEGDAGLDLHAADDWDLAPGERCLMGAGVILAIPQGYVGIIKDRSGWAARRGLTTLAGVVDATYRGEITVVLLNTGDRVIPIKRGDRIAQLLVLACPTVRLIPSDDLGGTERGARGFGSSGV